MIKPTVSRFVWYRPYTTPNVMVLDYAGKSQFDNGLPCVMGEPLPALITAVWGDDCVSVTVFDINGGSHGRPSIHLWHGEGERPTERRYCEWMPFQKGQATKTEEMEGRLREAHNLALGRER